MIIFYFSLLNRWRIMSASEKVLQKSCYIKSYSVYIKPVHLVANNFQSKLILAFVNYSIILCSNILLISIYSHNFRLFCPSQIESIANCYCYCFKINIFSVHNIYFILVTAVCEDSVKEMGLALDSMIYLFVSTS